MSFICSLGIPLKQKKKKNRTECNTMFLVITHN